MGRICARCMAWCTDLCLGKSFSLRPVLRFNTKKQKQVWMPCVLYALVLKNQNDTVLWCLVVVLPFFLYLFIRWISLIRNGDHYPMYERKRLAFYLFGSLIAMYLFESDSKAMALPCFYIASYLFTQVFVAFLKVYSKRMRPGIAMRVRLNGVRRHLAT
jgi:hypothetical protein